MKLSRTNHTAGLSLIELLVSMAIGLVVTLAITSVLIRSESSKRSSTSVNDINQSGAYAAYVLDRVIRSAGSGFSQSWSTTYGCLLNVASGGTPVLPLPAAIPASSAFANVTVQIRLAPLIIGKDRADIAGQTRGDVLMVMAGTAGVGESPQTVQPGSVTTAQLSLPTGLGYVTGDLLLLADKGVAAGCAVDQVGNGHAATDAGQVLPLAGTFHRDNSAYGADTIALQLGRVAAVSTGPTNPPEFKLYGVGPDSTLVSYDLLKPPLPDAQISDGIVEMRALYGLDTTGDGKLDSWVDASGAYVDTLLTDGSAASQVKLRQIIAVRVGLILRTALKEKAKATGANAVVNVEGVDSASADSRTIFGGVDVSAFKRVRPDEAGYRFRTVESIIPLRNVLLAP